MHRAFCIPGIHGPGKEQAIVFSLFFQSLFFLSGDREDPEKREKEKGAKKDFFNKQSLLMHAELYIGHGKGDGY